MIIGLSVRLLPLPFTVFCQKQTDPLTHSSDVCFLCSKASKCLFKTWAEAKGQQRSTRLACWGPIEPSVFSDLAFYVCLHHFAPPGLQAHSVCFHFRDSALSFNTDWNHLPQTLSNSLPLEQTFTGVACYVKEKNLCLVWLFLRLGLSMEPWMVWNLLQERRQENNLGDHW